MAACVYGQNLIAYDSEGATAPAEVLGPKYRVTWGLGADFPNVEVSGLLYLTQAGGTDPTSAAYIRVSSDNVTWFETSLNADLGPSDTQRAVIGGPQGWEYVQVRLAYGGTARPSATARVDMTASSPFTLSVVP